LPAAPLLTEALTTAAPGGSLSDREVAHRQAMLAQMEQNAIWQAGRR
jgi:hypothetical protein